ncbi:MAG: DUF4214 domain-containing protein [Lachnospiraceae bacterium]|nr:DUF4214 domain-containing protein [Lachnospiraceae bacterium]
MKDKLMKRMLTTVLTITTLIAGTAMPVSAQAYDGPPEAVVQEVAPSQEIYAFVERMYVNFLGRGSDPAGKENWATQLANGQIDSVGFVRGFAYSDEFQNNILPYLSTDELIESFYNTFFDRASDEAGKANWTSKYDNWASLDYILAGFVNSVEWANLCARFGITQGVYEGDPYNETLNGERLGAFVERFYTEALGRSSDAMGKRSWATNIASGKIQPADLVYGFLGSVEFAEKSAQMSNEEYVTCMYHTFFGREADEEGFNGWVASLNNGSAARQDIIDGFVGSQEYINMVNSFFDGSVDPSLLASTGYEFLDKTLYEAGYVFLAVLPGTLRDNNNGFVTYDYRVVGVYGTTAYKLGDVITDIPCSEEVNDAYYAWLREKTRDLDRTPDGRIIWHEYESCTEELTVWGTPAIVYMNEYGGAGAYKMSYYKDITDGDTFPTPLYMSSWGMYDDKDGSSRIADAAIANYQNGVGNYLPREEWFK